MMKGAKRESLILSLLGAAVSTAIAWRLGFAAFASRADGLFPDPRATSLAFFALHAYAPLLPIVAFAAGCVALQSKLTWKASFAAAGVALLLFWAFAWRVPADDGLFDDQGMSIRGNAHMLALCLNAGLLGVWYLATHRRKGAPSSRAWLRPLARFAKGGHPEESLCVALGATALAFGIAYAMYYWRLNDIIEFRTDRNSGYFHLSYFPALALPAVCVMTGWLAVHTKMWVTASLFTFVFGIFLLPVYAETHTPENPWAAHSATDLEMISYMLGLVLNGLFLAIWQLAVSEGARAGSAAPRAPRRPEDLAGEPPFCAGDAPGF